MTDNTENTDNSLTEIFVSIWVLNTILAFLAAPSHGLDMLFASSILGFLVSIPLTFASIIAFGMMDMVK